MPNELVQNKSLEDIELEDKKSELAQLEDELVDWQLRLSDLKVEMSVFQDRYLKTVGVLYAELDSVHADIAEALSALNPTDQEAFSKAAGFRAHAEETAREANQAKEQAPKPEFRPSENIKSLFREAAKHIHPDLASTEDERIRRHQVMTQVNAAYADGDETTLQNILDEWKDFILSEEGGVKAMLARVTRRIVQVTESIRITKSEIRASQLSEMGILLTKSKQAQLQKRDILLDMAAGIRADITRERERLFTMSSKGKNS